MTDRRREILQAAMAIADADGLDAVTMRAVARWVGVTPMALYPYVGGKAALLEGLIERLLDDLRQPVEHIAKPPAGSSAHKRAAGRPRAPQRSSRTFWATPVRPCIRGSRRDDQGIFVAIRKLTGVSPGRVASQVLDRHDNS